jgi:hypothetical protein
MAEILEWNIFKSLTIFNFSLLHGVGNQACYDSTFTSLLSKISHGRKALSSYTEESVVKYMGTQMV